MEIFGNLEGIESKDKNEDVEWKESWDRVTSCQKTRHLECKKQTNKQIKLPVARCKFHCAQIIMRS
jgi:hypothetical protein